jgi:hypothetical protein
MSKPAKCPYKGSIIAVDLAKGLKQLRIARLSARIMSTASTADHDLRYKHEYLVYPAETDEIARM